MWDCASSVAWNFEGEARIALFALAEGAGWRCYGAGGGGDRYPFWQPLDIVRAAQGWGLHPQELASLSEQLVELGGLRDWHGWSPELHEYWRLCRSTYRLSLDHVRPLVMGGTNRPSNLQILCVSCNARKGEGWA